MSVLYVCHGHPNLARGGGELSAWRLFEHFNRLEGFGNCGFLAAAPTPHHLPPGCEVMALAPRQWLIKPSANAVIHDTAVSLRDGGALHQALIGLAPRLIHLHHYLHVGLDLLPALKRWFPGAAVLLTLHDYWGPCAYEGRLLRRSGELCGGGDPEACNRCLAGDRRDQLAIRALRLRRCFAAVDHFLAPSYFLKRQYLRWGLPAQRISVVENLPPAQPLQLAAEPAANGTLVLGYFGQINPWKGLDLILEAVALARQQGLAVRLEIHGLDPGTLVERAQAADGFWQRCATVYGALAPEGAVAMGPYGPEQLTQRMAGLAGLVMGSIWFENSPMVIQEAYRHGLPVLAPRLGGMAEKVRDGHTGLLFSPGDAGSLASVMARLAQARGLRQQLSRQAGIAAQRAGGAALLHEQIYRTLAQKEKSVKMPTRRRQVDRSSPAQGKSRM